MTVAFFLANGWILLTACLDYCAHRGKQYIRIKQDTCLVDDDGDVKTYACQCVKVGSISSASSLQTAFAMMMAVFAASFALYLAQI